MELHLAPELESELDDIAARTGRTREQLATDALVRGLAHERWFLKAVEQGIASADAGRMVDDAEVAAWIHQWESSKPG
jgi:predicted transcriptional regulator